MDVDVPQSGTDLGTVRVFWLDSDTRGQIVICRFRKQIFRFQKPHLPRLLSSKMCTKRTFSVVVVLANRDPQVSDANA